MCFSFMENVLSICQSSIIFWVITLDTLFYYYEQFGDLPGRLVFALFHIAVSALLFALSSFLKY